MSIGISQVKAAQLYPCIPDASNKKVADCNRDLSTALGSHSVAYSQVLNDYDVMEPCNRIEELLEIDKGKAGIISHISYLVAAALFFNEAHKRTAEKIIIKNLWERYKPAHVLTEHVNQFVSLTSHAGDSLSIFDIPSITVKVNGKRISDLSQIKTALENVLDLDQLKSLLPARAFDKGFVDEASGTPIFNEVRIKNNGRNKQILVELLSRQSDTSWNLKFDIDETRELKLKDARVFSASTKKLKYSVFNNILSYDSRSLSPFFLKSIGSEDTLIEIYKRRLAIIDQDPTSSSVRPVMAKLPEGITPDRKVLLFGIANSVYKGSDDGYIDRMFVPLLATEEISMAMQMNRDVDNLKSYLDNRIKFLRDRLEKITLPQSDTLSWNQLKIMSDYSDYSIRLNINKRLRQKIGGIDDASREGLNVLIQSELAKSLSIARQETRTNYNFLVDHQKNPPIHRVPDNTLDLLLNRIFSDEGFNRIQLLGKKRGPQRSKLLRSMDQSPYFDFMSSHREVDIRQLLAMVNSGSDISKLLDNLENINNVLLQDSKVADKRIPGITNKIKEALSKKLSISSTSDRVDRNNVWNELNKAKDCSITLKSRNFRTFIHKKPGVVCFYKEGRGKTNIVVFSDSHHPADFIRPLSDWTESRLIEMLPGSDQFKKIIHKRPSPDLIDVFDRLARFQEESKKTVLVTDLVNTKINRLRSLLGSLRGAIGNVQRLARAGNAPNHPTKEDIDALNRVNSMVESAQLMISRRMSVESSSSSYTVLSSNPDDDFRSEINSIPDDNGDDLNNTFQRLFDEVDNLSIRVQRKYPKLHAIMKRIRSIKDAFRSDVVSLPRSVLYDLGCSDSLISGGKVSVSVHDISLRGERLLEVLPYLSKKQINKVERIVLSATHVDPDLQQHFESIIQDQKSLRKAKSIYAKSITRTSQVAGVFGMVRGFGSVIEAGVNNDFGAMALGASDLTLSIAGPLAVTRVANIFRNNQRLISLGLTPARMAKVVPIAGEIITTPFAIYEIVVAAKDIQSHPGNKDLVIDSAISIGFNTASIMGGLVATSVLVATGGTAAPIIIVPILIELGRAVTMGSREVHKIKNKLHNLHFGEKVHIFWGAILPGVGIPQQVEKDLILNKKWEEITHKIAQQIKEGKLDTDIIGISLPRYNAEEKRFTLGDVKIDLLNDKMILDVDRACPGELASRYDFTPLTPNGMKAACLPTPVNGIYKRPSYPVNSCSNAIVFSSKKGAHSSLYLLEAKKKIEVFSKRVLNETLVVNADNIQINSVSDNSLVLLKKQSMEGAINIRGGSLIMHPNEQSSRVKGGTIYYANNSTLSIRGVNKLYTSLFQDNITISADDTIGFVNGRGGGDHIDLLGDDKSVVVRARDIVTSSGKRKTFYIRSDEQGRASIIFNGSENQDNSIILDRGFEEIENLIANQIIRHEEGQKRYEISCLFKGKKGRTFSLLISCNISMLNQLTISYPLKNSQSFGSMSLMLNEDVEGLTYITPYISYEIQNKEEINSLISDKSLKPILKELSYGDKKYIFIHNYGNKFSPTNDGGKYKEMYIHAVHSRTVSIDLTKKNGPSFVYIKSLNHAPLNIILKGERLDEYYFIKQDNHLLVHVKDTGKIYVRVDDYFEKIELINLSDERLRSFSIGSSGKIKEDVSELRMNLYLKCGSVLVQEKSIEGVDNIYINDAYIEDVVGSVDEDSNLLITSKIDTLKAFVTFEKLALKDNIYLIFIDKKILIKDFLKKNINRKLYDYIHRRWMNEHFHKNEFFDFSQYKGKPCVNLGSSQYYEPSSCTNPSITFRMSEEEVISANARYDINDDSLTISSNGSSVCFTNTQVNAIDNYRLGQESIRNISPEQLNQYINPIHIHARGGEGSSSCLQNKHVFLLEDPCNIDMHIQDSLKLIFRNSNQCFVYRDRKVKISFKIKGLGYRIISQLPSSAQEITRLKRRIICNASKLIFKQYLDGGLSEEDRGIFDSFIDNIVNMRTLEGLFLKRKYNLVHMLSYLQTSLEKRSSLDMPVTNVFSGRQKFRGMLQLNKLRSDLRKHIESSSRTVTSLCNDDSKTLSCNNPIEEITANNTEVIKKILPSLSSKIIQFFKNNLLEPSTANITNTSSTLSRHRRSVEDTNVQFLTSGASSRYNRPPLVHLVVAILKFISERHWFSWSAENSIPVVVEIKRTHLDIIPSSSTTFKCALEWEDLEKKPLLTSCKMEGGIEQKKFMPLGSSLAIMLNDLKRRVTTASFILLNQGPPLNTGWTNIQAKGNSISWKFEKKICQDDRCIKLYASCKTEAEQIPLRRGFPSIPAVCNAKVSKEEGHTEDSANVSWKDEITLNQVHPNKLYEISHWADTAAMAYCVWIGLRDSFYWLAGLSTGILSKPNVDAWENRVLEFQEIKSLWNEVYDICERGSHQIFENQQMDHFVRLIKENPEKFLQKQSDISVKIDKEKFWDYMDRLAGVKTYLNYFEEQVRLFSQIIGKEKISHNHHRLLIHNIEESKEIFIEARNDLEIIKQHQDLYVYEQNEDSEKLPPCLVQRIPEYALRF